MNIRNDIDFIKNFADSHKFYLVQKGLYFIYQNEVVLFDSDRSKHIVTVEYQNLMSKLANRTKTLMDNIKSRVMFSGIDEYQQVHNRVLQLDQRVVYDLCNRNMVIDIGLNGYQISDKLTSSYLNLISNSSSKLQVEPIQSDLSLIDMLRELTNFNKEEDLILFSIWVVSLLFPSINSPIMILLGEQGSGKSFTSDLVKNIIDPSLIGKQHSLKSIQDFALLVSKSYLSIVDNLSQVSDDMSDAMCQTVSQGQYTTRRLYTNDEISTIDMKSKLIINGITIKNTKPDLLERSIVLHIDKLNSIDMVSEDVLSQKFRAYLPMILDRIFSTVSSALRTLPNTNLTNAPRLADFAKLAIAIGEGMEFDGEYVLSIYQGNIRDVGLLFLDDPIVIALKDVLNSCNGEFEGTATELLEQMKKFSHQELPKAANSLSNRLTRLSSELAKESISIEKSKVRGGIRLIKVTRLQNLN